jgi:hypothetical protein
MQKNPPHCHAIGESELISRQEEAQGHFPWRWLLEGLVCFILPLQISQCLRGPEKEGAVQKAPVLSEGPQDRATLPLRGRGCCCLNEGDLWKIPSHNRPIFQASLAAVV